MEAHTATNADISPTETLNTNEATLNRCADESPINDYNMPEIDLQEVEVMDTTISSADDVLTSLIGMKEEIINSISNGSCLSKMQPVLM